ncbi:MAG: glycosyltransferase family 4 protein [Gaiellaceae bacterium]
MRILLWHGYLLGGTGSNVYTRALARSWSLAGHEVVVFSQEPHPERFDLGGAQVVRPQIGRILPVFVLDRYEGLEARLLGDLTVAERDRYVELNAAALREHLPADLVFANHLVLGGPVAAAAGAPFAVKVHGSELEYAMRGNDELTAWGRRSLTEARAVYVGSGHSARALEEVVGPVERVRVVPPGVDVEEFVPQPAQQALEELLDQLRQDPPNPGNRDERLPDEGNAGRLEAFFSHPGPVVLYFGKLLRNKGVHVLFEALEGLDARVLVVGFGDYRGRLEELAGAGAVFTGQLEHRHLVHLLPLADVVVVPSVFPESFGMVAAEAAACGVPPLVARHSGLAEVAAELETAYPPARRHLLSFRSGDALDLRARLEELLSLAPRERAELGRAARRVAERRWSWSSVAASLLESFNLETNG